MQRDAQQALSFELDADLRHLDFGARQPPAPAITVRLEGMRAGRAIDRAAELPLRNPFQLGNGNTGIRASGSGLECLGVAARLKMAEELRGDRDGRLLSSFRAEPGDRDGRSDDSHRCGDPDHASSRSHRTAPDARQGRRFARWRGLGINQQPDEKEGGRHAERTPNRMKFAPTDKQTSRLG